MGIRYEKSADEPQIFAVHAAAFPTQAEARLVDALRAAGNLTVSLVAELAGRIAGHIALSPVTIAGKEAGLGLAPLAVLPDFQRQGIGGRLIEAGLAACRERDAGWVVVLGEPAYYARFGFQPASRFGLRDEYGGGEAFQVIELRPGAIPAAGGLVQYAAEFALVAE